MEENHRTQRYSRCDRNYDENRHNGLHGQMRMRTIHGHDRARVSRPMWPSRCGRTNSGGLALLHAQHMCWPYSVLGLHPISRDINGFKKKSCRKK